MFVLAESGKDLSVDPNSYYLGYDNEPSTHRAALVFSDRSIYRPNQKILWKIVAYEGRHNEGKLKVVPQTALQVRLLDPNSQVVATVQEVQHLHFHVMGGPRPWLRG